MVGHATTATIIIENTVFCGDLNNANDYAGGFVGWSGVNISISNSFFTGTHSGVGLFHPIAVYSKNDHPKYINDGAYYISTTPPSVVDNNYIGCMAGKPVYTAQPSGENYIKIAAPDGAEYFVEAQFYIVRSWDADNKKVVSTLTPCPNYTLIEGSHKEDWIGLGEDDGREHYYVVRSHTEYWVLNIFGTVHLILTDGAMLDCVHVKLEARQNAVLHVHSDSDAGTGSLRVIHSDYYYGPAEEPPHLFVESDEFPYEYAAGIGGGDEADMGTLIVHGGIIDVSNRGKGAAIGGGGEDGGINKNHKLEVFGGTVSAISRGDTAGAAESGAGIGGAMTGPQGGPVYIYGGNVCAVGHSSGRTGIGSGRKNAGGEVHILGGTVEASGWTEPAIGSYDNKKNGPIELPDNARVSYGETIYRSSYRRGYYGFTDGVATNAERVAAIRNYEWCLIEICDHTPQNGDAVDVATTYTIDGNNHTKYCRYCNVTITEAHTFSEDGTCACGRRSDEAPNTSAITVYTAGSNTAYTEPRAYTVLKDKAYALPVPDNIEGMTFMGYLEAATAPTGIEMLDTEAATLVDAGQTITPETDKTYYARYRYDYETAWTWSDDCQTATVNISCAANGDAKEGISATFVEVSKRTEPTTEADGEVTYYASASYERASGITYQFTDRHTVELLRPTVDISLEDNASNAKTLTSYEGRRANVTLNRTLHKDGSWNTLCLPFNVDDISGTPLEGATVKTLESSDYNFATATLTLNFTTGTLTALSAGKPYLVMWTEGSDDSKHEFHDVTISGTQGGSTGSMYVDFVGTFSPVPLTANDKTVLYLGDSNTLYYPSADMNIGSCRAYFKLHNGISVGGLSAEAPIRLNFGDEEEETGIREISSPSNPSNFSNSYFTLDGRRLKEMPTTRGIYIVNGKKVMIK